MKAEVVETIFLSPLKKNLQHSDTGGKGHQSVFQFKYLCKYWAKEEKYCL